MISSVDRPWLKEGQKVQKLQEKVYLALQHSLHKNVSDEKLDKVKRRATPPHPDVRAQSLAFIKNSPLRFSRSHRWCPSCPQ